MSEEGVLSAGKDHSAWFKDKRSKYNFQLESDDILLNHLKPVSIIGINTQSYMSFLPIEKILISFPLYVQHLYQIYFLS